MREGARLVEQYQGELVRPAEGGGGGDHQVENVRAMHPRFDVRMRVTERGDGDVVGGLQKRELRCGLVHPARPHQLLSGDYGIRAAGGLRDPLDDELTRRRLDGERAGSTRLEGTGDQLERALV